MFLNLGLYNYKKLFILCYCKNICDYLYTYPDDYLYTCQLTCLINLKIETESLALFNGHKFIFPPFFLLSFHKSHIALIQHTHTRTLTQTNTCTHKNIHPNNNHHNRHGIEHHSVAILTGAAHFESVWTHHFMDDQRGRVQADQRRGGRATLGTTQKQTQHELRQTIPRVTILLR